MQLRKVTSTGAHIWDHIYNNGYSHGMGTAMDIHANGDLILVGSGYGVWLLKTDSAGNALWNEDLTGPGLGCRDIAILPDGYILTENGPAWWNTTFGMYTKVDFSAQYVWSGTFGEDALANAVAVTNNGIVVAGHRKNYIDGTLEDGYIRRMDFLGEWE